MKILNILIPIFAITIIWQFFNNDSNEIISDRGYQVLNDPEKMKDIKTKIKNHKSGPIII